MAIANKDLKSLLESESTRIFSDGGDVLLYPFCHEGQMFQIWIETTEGGEYVRFLIPCLLIIGEVRERENVLLRLLELNYRLKLLKFCFDPADGEVSVTIELPVEDGTLTKRQADRCMFCLTSIAMRERDNLSTLLTTGVYPGSSDPEFTDMVDRLLGEDEVDECEVETGSDESTADC